MKSLLILFAVLAYFIVLVGCEQADSRHVDRNLSNPHPPKAAQAVASEAPIAEVKSNAPQKTSDSTEKIASQSALADDVNWQIFKKQLSQYELNKESRNEDEN